MSKYLVAFLLLLPLVWVFPKGVGAEENYRLEAWLDRLEQCESGGRADISIIDSNGLHSRGSFQFQDGTFLKYVRMYHMADAAESKEVFNFIFDKTFQRDLVRNMIKDNPKNSSHWLNCSKKIGPVPL